MNTVKFTNAFDACVGHVGSGNYSVKVEGKVRGQWVTLELVWADSPAAAKRDAEDWVAYYKRAIDPSIEYRIK